jgi:hypothetical protein
MNSDVMNWCFKIAIKIEKQKNGHAIENSRAKQIIASMLDIKSPTAIQNHFNYMLAKKFLTEDKKTIGTVLVAKNIHEQYETFKKKFGVS